MKEVVYVPDPYFLDGMRRDVDNNEQMMEFAKIALSTAVVKSPGRAKRWLKLATDEKGQPVLISTSSIWHLIEYGSVHNSPYAPLRRGVQACGAKFVDPGAKQQ